MQPPNHLEEGYIVPYNSLLFSFVTPAEQLTMDSLNTLSYISREEKDQATYEPEGPTIQLLEVEGGVGQTLLRAPLMTAVALPPCNDTPTWLDL